MNNELLKLEQKVLENEKAQWKHLFIYTLIGAIIIILALVLWQHHQRIKRLEKENVRLGEARDKAVKAFDMKNEFITHITDELRAPMNPIEGLSDILSSGDYHLQPEEREVLRKHIKDNSKRIKKLIDELGELSLFESKKSLPIDYTMSPNHLCRHMLDSMRPLCKPGVRMLYESDLPDDYTVQTNLEAMESLLKHLLQNAIQYTDEGVITLSCVECGDRVRTSVTDTGRGIPEDRKPHVFDTFREMGDNVKLQGLGLTICQAIVKLLHGRIWLDEEYTDGSRFIFELPKMQKQQDS
jgi:signal transduction histidine kinase